VLKRVSFRPYGVLNDGESFAFIMPDKVTDIFKKNDAWMVFPNDLENIKK